MPNSLTQKSPTFRSLTMVGDVTVIGSAQLARELVTYTIYGSRLLAQAPGVGGPFGSEGYFVSVLGEVVRFGLSEPRLVPPLAFLFSAQRF